MTGRTSSPCRNARCPNLQPCPVHPIKPWGRSRRPPEASSGWEWQRIRTRILLRDGYICRYCGKPAQVVDHVLGLTFGGMSNDANLVAACKQCNEKKRQQEARAGRRA